MAGSAHHVSPEFQAAASLFASVRLAVEDEPAELVAETLVVEDQLPDRLWELGTLPSALRAAGLRALVLRRCRLRRPDRIGGGTELVGRDVGHGGGLTGCVRRVPGRSTQVPGRTVGMTGGRPSLGHGDLAPRPGAGQLDRPAGPVVPWPSCLEVVEYMLRAVGRPRREDVVVVVPEAAA